MRPWPALAAAAAWGGTAGPACAPPGSLRPASAIPAHRSGEVGFGEVLVSPRTYVDEPWGQAAQAWATHSMGELVRISVVTAFDAEAFAGGLTLAVLPLQTDRLAAGLELELGYAWAGLSFPLAARTVGPAWVYASPRLGTWGDDLTPAVPFGLDLHLADAVSARAEMQLSWADFEPNNRRFHYGLALAYQFGESSR